MIEIREAQVDDIEAISAMLMALVEAGMRQMPADVDFVRERYVSGPVGIRCSIADEAGRIRGLQSLVLAVAGNHYGVEPGWGVIGTHVDPTAHRLGLGRRLFDSTRAAAIAAGLQHVDATIGADNDGALAYYEAMGFRTYRRQPGGISKRYDVPAS